MTQRLHRITCVFLSSTILFLQTNLAVSAETPSAEKPSRTWQAKWTKIAIDCYAKYNKSDGKEPGLDPAFTEGVFSDLNTAKNPDGGANAPSGGQASYCNAGPLKNERKVFLFVGLLQTINNAKEAAQTEGTAPNEKDTYTPNLIGDKAKKKCETKGNLKDSSSDPEKQAEFQICCAAFITADFVKGKKTGELKLVNEAEKPGAAGGATTENPDAPPGSLIEAIGDNKLDGAKQSEGLSDLDQFKSTFKKKCDAARETGPDQNFRALVNDPSDVDKTNKATAGTATGT